jgi:uncharacterized membrane protein YfcA
MISLAVVAFVAFSCEALAGFGGTVLALALGAHLRPLTELLAIIVPANLALSAGMVAAHARAVDGRLLLKQILPAMTAGLPFGLALQHTSLLRPLFALVVVALAVVGAVEPPRRQDAKKGGSILLLWLAGVVHGAYGSGGPLAVFVAAREVVDKHALRATLAALWLVLNAVLAATLTLDGHLTARTLAVSAALLPIIAGALAVGELLAARLSERPFRACGAALLGAAGVLLFVRGA